MLRPTTLFSALALTATSVLAQSSQSAILIITASHGGAGNGLTNRTITVPLNQAYTNSALDAVSYLYVTGANGIPLSSISCQAYQDAEGTVPGGNAFNSSVPALLSTNTVDVGSVVCTTSYVALAPPGGVAPGAGNITSSSAPTASASHTGHHSGNLSSTSRAPLTSVFVTTISPSDGASATRATVTSVFVPGGAGGGNAEPTGDAGSGDESSSATSATASATAGLSTPNAGMGGREFGAEIYAGLAVVGLGIAYVL